MRTLPLAALAVFLTGCGGEAEDSGHEQRAEVRTSRASLGPLPAQPASAGTGQHTDFAKAFTPGTIIDREGETIEIDVVEVGLLDQEADGPLHAGDPLAGHTAVPLPVRVVQGRYPVEISRVHIRAKDGSGEARQIAASRVRVDEGTPVEWRWAGQFGAEAGIGAWMTPLGAQSLAHSEGTRVVRRLTEEAGDDSRTHGEFRTDPHHGRVDVAWCHTGLGGGSYDLYVGLDADGKPVEIAADYKILVEPVEIIVVIDEPSKEPPGIIPFAELDELGIVVRRAHKDETTPTHGDPMWFEVDAQANRRNPAMGFPEVIALDAHDREVKLTIGNTGFKLWVSVPPHADQVAKLAVAVRTGFKPM